jgi:hypothetical protein
MAASNTAWLNVYRPARIIALAGEDRYNRSLANVFVLDLDSLPWLFVR